MNKRIRYLKYSSKSQSCDSKCKGTYILCTILFVILLLIWSDCGLRELMPCYSKYVVFVYFQMCMCVVSHTYSVHKPFPWNSLILGKIDACLNFTVPLAKISIVWHKGKVVFSNTLTQYLVEHTHIYCITHNLNVITNLAFSEFLQWVGWCVHPLTPSSLCHGFM